MPIDLSPISTESLIAQIAELARSVAQANSGLINEVATARTTALPGVIPQSPISAHVSSKNLEVFGWNPRTYLPEVQIDALLDALHHQNHGQVRDLVAWLDKDQAFQNGAGHPLSCKENIPFGLHPEVARRVAEPVRAWLVLSDTLTHELKHVRGPADEAKVLYEIDHQSEVLRTTFKPPR